ncbi:Salicylate hydroxylase [Rhodococcus wratislaviensis]|uniref:Salicylate hydroxylase n=1 Tax=Rhodococcus wratislaviensis TaxID=44752 RepID=A0A402CL03_RHOWR|nr:FAD-dependent monooxygenase [Rhodococcus wratislaviensis]GCE44225.1 Salicylate hydroxylase [Rhodococcus wratislaviensis]
MNPQKHAVVVGAGLAGLATAVGLRHVGGWRVTVLESAPEFGPVGSGISMYPNAMRALAALGFEEQLNALPPFEVGHQLRATNGDELTRVDGATVRDLWGGQIYGFHRAHLHELLRSGLPDDAVRVGVRITGAAPGPNAKWSVRSHGTTVIDDADLVIAADGIDSPLRIQHWPDLPRAVYTGSTAWRGISPFLPEQERSIVQTFGTGAEFGFLPLTDGRTYWYASAATAPGVREPDERAALLARYAGWHDPIPRLIEASDAILHHDIYALPEVPQSLVSGRLVLVGDAGHAMTPHLGQGGCTALEDAVVLASEIASSPDDVDSALTRYDAQRRPRVSELAQIAEGIRAHSHESGEAGTQERNRTWPLLPAAEIYRTSADVANWFPPTIVNA